MKKTKITKYELYLYLFASIFIIIASFTYSSGYNNYFENVYGLLSNKLIMVVLLLLSIVFIHNEFFYVGYEKRIRCGSAKKFTKLIEEKEFYFIKRIFLIVCFLSVIITVITSGINNANYIVDGKNMLLEFPLLIVKLYSMLLLFGFIYINTLVVIGRKKTNVIVIVFIIINYLFLNGKSVSIFSIVDCYLFDSIFQEVYVFLIIIIIILLLYNSLKYMESKMYVLKQLFNSIKVKNRYIISKCKRIVIAFFLFLLFSCLIINIENNININDKDSLLFNFYNSIGLQFNPVKSITGFLMTVLVFSLNSYIVILSLDFSENFSDSFLKLRINKSYFIIINIISILLLCLLLCLLVYLLCLLFFWFYYKVLIIEPMKKYLLVNFSFVVIVIIILEIKKVFNNYSLYL